MKKAISHFYEILDYLSNLILVVLFAVLVVLLVLEVFGRFFFSFSFMWTEEVARYLFIWITFIGAGVVFSKGGHLAVDVLLNKFPIKVKYVIGIAFYVLMIAFLLLTIYTGFQYSALNYSKPLYSTYVTNLGVVYLAVPVGGILMVLNIIRELYKMYTMGIEYYTLKEGVF